MTRFLYLAHRWLGMGLGLMILLWYLSGLVMLFVARPHLDEAERLAGLPALAGDSLRLSPQAAWQVLGVPGTPQAVRLNATDGRPAYYFLAGGRWSTVHADTGTLPGELDADKARRLARRYVPDGGIAGVSAIDIDQWTVFRSFDTQRPFWRVELDDGRHYYLSTRSGEVALDTSTSERAWNWLGSVIHWIYFTPVRQNTPLWRNILLWGSFAALLLAASGLWLGWQRLRLKRRYREGRITPYRQAWKRWHHLLGLTGGAVVATWLLSGWFSMAPFGLGENPAKPFKDGMTLAVATLPPLPELLPDTREVEWLVVGKQVALIEKAPSGTRISLPGSERRPELTLAEISSAMETAYATPIAHSGWLETADSRYFPLRHHPRKFPVARIALADREETVLYVSPATGRIDVASNRHDFVYRWLYQGLHRFDFPVLVDRPLLRDIIIILLSLCGMALSLTGCVLAWRRISPRGDRTFPWPPASGASLHDRG